MKHATALLLASILLFAPLALASRTDELNAAALALASPHLRIQPRQNGCATDACLNFGMKVAGCMQGNSDPLAPAKCACDNSAQAVGCISTCDEFGYKTLADFQEACRQINSGSVASILTALSRTTEAPEATTTAVAPTAQPTTTQGPAAPTSTARPAGAGRVEAGAIAALAAVAGAFAAL